MSLNTVSQIITFIDKLYIPKMNMPQSKVRTAFKDSQPTSDIKTNRKNEVTFTSPFRNTEEKYSRASNLQFRSPLREQEIEDYNRIKTELKKGIELAKENFSLNQSGHWVSIEEYNSLNQEFKYETERMLFEIQKLHDTIYEVERAKNLEIEKLREEQDKMTYLNMSNVRVGYNAQVDMLETQLRKSKQLLNDKTAEYQNTIKRQEREIKHLNNQTSRLNSEVKTIIQQKNTEAQLLGKSSAEKLQSMKKEYEQKQKQIQDAHTKEIGKLNRLLQLKQTKLQQQVGYAQNVEADNDKLQMEIQSRKIETLDKFSGLEDEQRQIYNTLKETFQRESSQIIAQITENYRMKEEVLQNQISKLKKFLILKNQDRQKLIQHHEERFQFTNQSRAEVERQNQELKKKLYKIRQQHMQQLEVIKVKMAGLHENDIKTLIQTYQLKLETLVSDSKQKSQTITRLRKNLYDETNHRYQMRKKYAIQLSKLNQKVIKLRSGMTAMETDMKEKIETERSMLLLTSRNLIKDVETKTSGSKFSQIQLRKIQQLYAEHEKQFKQSNQIIDEKVKMAEEELDRLSKHVIQEKNRHKQTENTYKEIVKSKDQAILKLKRQLESIQHPEFDNAKELQMIDQLKNEIHQKRLENGLLKDHCDLLEKKISLMKAEIDQYQMENEITQEEAKKQFEKISKENMDQFLKFYEARIAALEQEKNDLKELLSSKEEKITSLVQKYQELQKTMKSTLNKIKKRTDLENKVMNLGMDNNLVKNMAEIVRNNIEENV